MRDSKGAFDKDSRCDASPVFCIVAAEQATRNGTFEGFFGQAFHRAALANAPLLPSLSGDSPPQTPPPERASATRCPRETIGRLLESTPPGPGYRDTSARNWESSQRKGFSHKKHKRHKKSGSLSVLCLLCFFVAISYSGSGLGTFKTRKFLRSPSPGPGHRDTSGRNRRDRKLDFRGVAMRLSVGHSQSEAH